MGLGLRINSRPHRPHLHPVFRGGDGGGDGHFVQLQHIVSPIRPHRPHLFYYIYENSIGHRC